MNLLEAARTQTEELKEMLEYNTDTTRGILRAARLLYEQLYSAEMNGHKDDRVKYNAINDIKELAESCHVNNGLSVRSAGRLQEIIQTQIFLDDNDNSKVIKMNNDLVSEYKKLRKFVNELGYYIRYCRKNDAWSLEDEDDEEFYENSTVLQFLMYKFERMFEQHLGHDGWSK